MLNVDERLKELYRADSTDKQLILDFYHKGEDEPYLRLSSSNIKAETMELDEALSSNENLEFGSCEASQFKIHFLMLRKCKRSQNGSLSDPGGNMAGSRPVSR